MEWVSCAEPYDYVGLKGGWSGGRGILGDQRRHRDTP